MRLRLPIFLLLSFGLLVAKAPATLLDRALCQVSDNAIRLIQAEGSLWEGRGILVLRDDLHAPIAWHWLPTGLPDGELRWKAGSGRDLQGELALRPGGFTARNILFDAPAGVVLPLIPGTLTHAGWDGRLHLQVAAWSCDWNTSCQGRAHLQWHEARSELLPGLRFGSHALEFQASGPSISFVIRSLAGDVALNGTGRIDTDGENASFSGRLSAPAPVLRLLPSIAAGIAHPDGKEGSLRIAYAAPQNHATHRQDGR